MTLTPRDESILEVLTLKVRLLSLSQTAAGWWKESSSPTERARKRMAELVGAGLIAREAVNARPLLSLDTPVVQWIPGKADPDYDAVSYRLQSRWTAAPRSTTVYIATRKAAYQFGGAGGRLKHRLQATHDLHVSQVFIRFLHIAPRLAEAWAGEEIVAPTRREQKLPDAMIREPDGAPTLVVEFGGAYDAKRVRKFHEDCRRRSLRYQLW
jgi:hypothetical protein